MSAAQGALRIRPVATDADWEGARAIRARVFLAEQGVPERDEWDAHDWPTDRGRTCTHLLAEVDGRPVATVRWRPVGGTAAKLERMAVVPEARGRGLAHRLVEAVLDGAQGAGLARVVLHAQAHLVGLYAAHGFRAEGAPFDEAGIPHVKMRWEAGNAP